MTQANTARLEPGMGTRSGKGGPYVDLALDKGGDVFLIVEDGQRLE